jgi:hypothetical protein
MPVFVVIATRGADQIGERVGTLDGIKARFPIKDDAWLVTYEGTTRSLAEELGIRSGDSGSGLVFPIANYAGRAASELWEWLKLHMPKDES